MYCIASIILLLGACVCREGTFLIKPGINPHSSSRVLLWNREKQLFAMKVSVLKMSEAILSGQAIFMASLTTLNFLRGYYASSRQTILHIPLVQTM